MDEVAGVKMSKLKDDILKTDAKLRNIHQVNTNFGVNIVQGK